MAIKRNSKLFLVLFLGTLSAFGPFVTDLYLPALPLMSNYFSASTSTIQLTLTGSMIGLALGQLLIGPNIYAMIILRFIQGISSAGAVVISRAVSTDLYKGKEMVQFFALLMAVNGLAPILSPVVGSLLLEFTDWRGIFITLAVIGIIIIIASLKFHESLAEEKRLNLPITKTYHSIVLVSKIYFSQL